MSVFNWKTPFELICGCEANYTHLKVMGCFCYSSIPSFKRDKLDPRRARCVFLGYLQRQKVYKLFFI